MENLLWTLRSRKSKLDILGPSGVFDIPEFCRTNRSTLDFLRTLLQAGIVENRLWNCLVEPNDRLWIFLGRCSTLELSKIDFGILSCGTNRSTLDFFWDAARLWNCRKSTLEYCLVEPVDQIDFGIYLWTLLDAGIVENRLWNCWVCQWPRLPREKSIGWSWSLLTAVCCQKMHMSLHLCKLKRCTFQDWRGYWTHHHQHDHKFACHMEGLIASLDLSRIIKKLAWPDHPCILFMLSLI